MLKQEVGFIVFPAGSCLARKQALEDLFGLSQR